MPDHAFKFTAVVTVFLLVGAACATLPDADAIIERHSGQAARFENARGSLSTNRNVTILAELKRKSGDIDILDKQIALEQAIVGSPLVLDNNVTLLQDGAETYAAMFAAIRNAQDHINLESYIIEGDETGQQFADLLLEQQRRGVQVNVIYDSIGAISTPKAFFERLTAGGIAVLEFNPINPLMARTEWLLNNRDHRKLLVVDGRVAFIGGINISSVYSSGSSLGRARAKAGKHSGASAENSVSWRDTDLQIEGPAVAELQKLFLATWEKQRGPTLASKAYFPELKKQGNDIVRVIGSTSDDPYSLIYLTLISAIGNAEKHIRITSAYFVPDPQLLKSLIEAAGRGVEVSLILPSFSDSALVFHAGRSHYEALLKGGVRIYERQGALLHSKTALIDGVWSCVGSTNLDWRSFVDNDEVNAVILGREFAQQMQTMFAKDRAASAAIDPERWESRSMILKLKEWGAGLWQRML